MVDKADKKVLGECFPKFQFTAGSAVTERTRFSAVPGSPCRHERHMDANYTPIRWIQAITPVMFGMLGWSPSSWMSEASCYRG